MARNFEILGAAWGTADVTEKVWSLVTKDGLNIQAADTTFDTYSGSAQCEKYLVVCYQYTGGKPSLKIGKEKEIMAISYPEYKEEQHASRLSANWQADISNAHSRNPGNKEDITILGAAWGDQNVTEIAQSFVLNGNKAEFRNLATNEQWKAENSWWKKILVVVYQYSGIPMISIVKEKKEVHFTISPPLFILGAAYGHEVVTNEVQSLVKHHQLTLTPAEDLPKHTSPKFKSLVMVYQFGSEQPQLFIGDQSGVSVSITYESRTKEVVKVDPNQLLILGAAYGLQDITKKVRSTVFDNELVTSVTDSAMGVVDDEWKMYYKTLVIMHRYGTGPPMVTIKKQGEKIEIQKELLPIYGGLIDSKHLVSNTDTISLIALNNKYVAVDPDSGKLIANTEGTYYCCEFAIMQPSSDGAFFLQDKSSQKFCEENKEGYLILNGDQGKTGFILTLSMTGKVKLATVDNKFVRLTDDQFLKADCTEHFSASTSFQLEISCSATPGRESLSSTKTEKEWLEFLWQAIGGFFLALGLKPFLSKVKPSIRLLYLIRDNPISSIALQTLCKELRSTTSETYAIRSAISFIRKIWTTGLIWRAFKFLRLEEGMILYTEIFSQVAQVVLLRETEACLLLAGLTTWVTQLIEVSKKLEDLH